MARLIPNANTWIGFNSTIASTAAPTVSEINGCTVLTSYVISLNASAQGNVVPTPAFDSLYETSIIGTSQATFTGDFYRDSSSDTAWTTLARGVTGYIVISRFGGGGTNAIPNVSGNKVEVWPVTITSRAMANMANNAVMTFTVTAAVPAVPQENAVVA